MDEIVKKALQKWPDVPHAYGWISLNQSGKWRFHSGGEYQVNPAGESIDNAQISAFLGRNYEAEDNGCWYIQNGPQRVYVSLPFAPLIMRLNDTAMHFVTHNGQRIRHINRWFMDEDGRIYAQSDVGPCMLDAHDMQHFTDHCIIESARQPGETLPLDEKILGEIMSADNTVNYLLSYGKSLDYRGPVEHVGSEDIPERLGFVRFPEAHQGTGC